jgi:hypothetical protein
MKYVYFHMNGGTVASFHNVSDEHAGAIIAWAQQEPGSASGTNAVTFTTEETSTEKGGTHVFLRTGVAYIEVREAP